MLISGDESTVNAQGSQTRFWDRVGLGWFGQTAASVFWIVSVFVYGVSGAGDWLQRTLHGLQITVLHAPGILEKFLVSLQYPYVVLIHRGHVGIQHHQLVQHH